jgi:hypothetical protein
MEQIGSRWTDFDENTRVFFKNLSRKFIKFADNDGFLA